MLAGNRKRDEGERGRIFNLIYFRAGDTDEFRQIVINTIVEKKIYQVKELKKFFDDVIDVNAHLDVAALTEIVNEICNLLAE